MQPIQYISTRISPGGGSSGPVGVETAIVNGMPPDGGLYVPTGLPPLPKRVFDLAPLSYSELALLVLEPFFPGWEGGALRSILERAYGTDNFDQPDIAPLVPLQGLGAPGGGRPFYLLELFHGKTCAFKDMALSVLGGLLRESLDRLGKDEPVLVLTATSGDTGSAALEGLSGVEGIHTAVFYPEGGTSEIQRLQMTTTSPERRFVAAVKGNFDDAQGAVKKVFARAASGEGPLAGVRLSSANSINIGRLLPQIVYYAAAWRALAARGSLGEGGIMHVAVPTGNFGDILAAKYAKEMGLPVGALICASNANKVLADFFATGIYDRRRELVKTESPSMDILVSSNLERLVYMATKGDGARVASLMKDLADRGWFEMSPEESARMSDFASGWCSDFSAKSTIAEIWRSCSRLVDPHTATAVEVAMRASAPLESAPVVIAATASPFKFPRACLDALKGTIPGARGKARRQGAPGAAGAGGAAPAGDFGLAEKLSALTGCPMPEPLRAFAAKTVSHNDVVSVEGVEAALAEYARSAMKAKP